MGVSIDVAIGGEGTDGKEKSQVSTPTETYDPESAKKLTDFFLDLVEIYRFSVIALNNSSYSIAVDDGKYKEALSGKGNFHRDASYSIALSNMVKSGCSNTAIDPTVIKGVIVEISEIDSSLKSILNVAQNLGIKIVPIPSQEVKDILNSDFEFIRSNKNVTGNAFCNLEVKDDFHCGDKNILYLDEIDIINYIISLFF